MDDEKFTIGERLQHAWNAFRNKDPAKEILSYDYDRGVMSYSQPHRTHHYITTDKTIATAIYNRISTDVASYNIQHIRTDHIGRYLEVMDSGLNNCLNIEANIDQAGAAFIQDLVLSMLDEGVVAAIPVDTSINPMNTNSFDIETMRVGKIVGWQPRHVKCEVYNDTTGQRETLYLAKDKVAIIENPFYTVMNEPNSVLQRLIRKLALLDAIDEQSGAGTLDLIIQLPYVVKSETRQKQANKRRGEIVDQLENSKYGIAYIDGTEKVVQLNRPVENNLMTQIEYLTSMLYGQLGIDKDILSGTASEDTMTNYYVRTINPILDAITDEFIRKFLTKTARTQGQTIRYFRDPFRLTPTNAIADIADKFTRNEILTPNEVRGIVGFLPAEDPAADELRNRNISQSNVELEEGMESPDQMMEPQVSVMDETMATPIAEIQNEGENYEV